MSGKLSDWREVVYLQPVSPDAAVGGGSVRQRVQLDGIRFRCGKRKADWSWSCLRADHSDDPQRQASDDDRWLHCGGRTADLGRRSRWHLPLKLGCRCSQINCRSGSAWFVFQPNRIHATELTPAFRVGISESF